MKSKVAVTVAGQEFTLLTEEDEQYVRRVAGQVDAELHTLMSGGQSLTRAALLTALNIADGRQRIADTADHLRSQVKEYREEAQSLKSELAEARREINRLRGGVR